jgi:hypothetical protein
MSRVGRSDGGKENSALQAGLGREKNEMEIDMVISDRQRHGIK